MNDTLESAHSEAPKPTPRIYRVMKELHGAPRAGDSSCCLGVRLSDVDLRDESTVIANGKGMSVNPSVDVIFVPRRLGPKLERRGCKGNDTHRIWRFGDSGFVRAPLGERIELLPDSSDHGNVVPTMDLELAALQSALAATRDNWVVEEP